MRMTEHKTDFCVVGGGIAGLCAAVSAARHGAKVVLMQDRPMLGGNASSEIRMWMGGAKGKDTRETGLIEEMFLENYYRNTSLSFSVWDSVLYGLAKGEPNITLLLNCSCNDAKTENGRILSVKGWQGTSETWHTVYADYFADCSGDSILAPLTGAHYRVGREAKAEYGETIPPDTADSKTMGMSILFQLREKTEKTEFIPPEWAYVYEDDKALNERPHYVDENCNFWWMELGGMQDSIHDTDSLTDELMKIAYGVWDHVKNRGDHGADNWDLDWVGAFPGKRESRRYKGAYTVCQSDVEAGGKFDDAVAYAGWSMDDHFPEGFYYEGGHPTIYHHAPSPWCLPFRAMYSENIENLLFAGRNISVTHAALSSCRVMASCGTIGQAVGTAVGLAVTEKTDVRKLDTEKLQQALLYDDSYIPGVKRKVSELTKRAKVENRFEVLRNGADRAMGDELNGVSLNLGENIEFSFDEAETIKEMRIVFDSDLNRPKYNMPCNFKLHETNYKVPKTLVKAFRVIGYGEDGSEHVICQTAANRKRLVLIPVDGKYNKIKLHIEDSYGNKTVTVFSVDFN